MKLRNILYLLGILVLAAGGFMAWQYHRMTTGEGPQEDVVATAVSEAGLYAISATPADGNPGVGPIHTWTLTLRDRQGNPVSGARISVDGGMRAHGHGLPTAPEVTEETGPGTYLIDGVKFSMTGEWQLRFAIEAEPGSDTGEISFTIR